MDCPSCGHSNGEGACFCGECGGSLTVAVICPACGAENTEARRFCTACGQSLGDSDRAARASTNAVLGNLVERDPGAYTPGHLAEKILGARGELEGERKQVTVMFVDIVGSMDLARALNPERWLELLERFLELACGAVDRFEGTVDKFTGDGVMALFGAPLAHEDHARRACLAALALQERVSPFAKSLEQERIDFAVRTGLNSGEVIVGEIGDRGQMSYTAIGHTVGIAQRMESLAPPGSTALSVTTASLVAGEFELNELGEFEVRGSGAPERVLQLAGRAVSRDRVEAASARGGLSPFVGRAGEQVKLKAALELAQAGDGQVLGIVGEPGVGKSRLAHEFVEDCAARGIAVQRARALSHGREVPLMPVLELWRSTLGVGEADEPAAARERIEESLKVLDPSFGEDLPLIFDFLGVPDPERPTPKMDPEARQRLLLALVRRLVHARSHLQLGLIVIEDLHWLDDASALFLAELVRAGVGTRTLLILTYRPEYVAQVLNEGHGMELALRPLDQAAVGQLLASLLGTDPSLDGLTEMIASRALGNPFFCEELVAALAESGHLVGRRGSYRLARTLEEIVLPATVQATLADRIDRLAERERELVQVASVIGQELSAELLGAVSGISDGELSASLHALVASEHLIERRGEAGGQYAFKHPLTQEVAYWSQLSDRRRRVHREAALAIDELYPDRLDELAALVGHHYEAAGDALAAADHYTRAATWMGYSDIVQARAHWQRVASLVKTVPESPKANVLACIAHQGELQCGWRLGMSEQEAEEHYRAGRELALRIGDSASLLGITGFYSVLCGLSGRVREYDELAEEADRLSLEIGIPALRMAIIVSTMFARWVRGRLTDALALAEEGIAIGAEDPTLGAGLSLTCPFAFSHLIKGMALNMMGRPEQAKSAFERALALAQEHGDLETAGYAKQNFALVAWTTGRMTESERSLAAEALDNAQRTGSSQARVQALACLGIAHLGLGQVDQAIPAFERSVKLALETRTGHEVLPMWQAGLVDALLLAGDHATALDTARDALARAERYGTEAWLPTCHRALADALLASGESDAAAAARQALESAVAAMTVTGARYELPFIERTQEKLAPVI